MGIDVFTRAQFEDVLTTKPQRDAGKRIWEPLGLIDGEYAYRMPTGVAGLWIHIRSSLKADGVAAECGRDSIRVWLVDEVGLPQGSKLSRWITRVHGWAYRLIQEMREYARLAHRLDVCQCCGKRNGAFKIKRGKNAGRIFQTCRNKDCVTITSLFEARWVDHHSGPKGRSLS